MSPLPRLLVYTDHRTANLADLWWRSSALAGIGSDLALVARDPDATTDQLHRLALGLQESIAGSGARLMVSGRADLAAGLGAGVILRRGDLPAHEVRSLVGRQPIVSSVHSALEAEQARDEGSDGVVAGNIWETPSHPHKAGAGPALIEQIATLGIPVWAIGGVDAARASEARQAGATGVAVIRAVWDSADPLQSALDLISPWRLE